jgi:hypothetical protein
MCFSISSTNSIPLVEYKAGENSLLVIECKSYLGNPGVRFHGFDGSNEKAAGRFKLFNKPRYERSYSIVSKNNWLKLDHAPLIPPSLCVSHAAA